MKIQILPDCRYNYAYEKRLHIMDSTTITLFSDILKGAVRNPKHEKMEAIKRT